MLIRRYKLHHILLWLFFFAGWYLFRAADFPTVQSGLMVTVIKVGVLMLLVYLTNYFLIPAFLYKKKYLLFGALFMAAILVVGVIKVYLMILVLQPHLNAPMSVFVDYRERIYDDIIPLFLLVSTGTAMKVALDYILSQKKMAEISQERSEAELQYLKSQINPHFVFNTLNSIYFQIDKSNTDARETLLQFADLLRYQLYECNAPMISIEKEMAYLEDYIHLQQKRKDENYKVWFHRAPEVRGFRIVPLLLVPFVENAFKHISHFADQPNSICVSAKMENDVFNFAVTNTKEPGQPERTDYVGGIGLTNVHRRLDLLYPGKYSLQIIDNENTFTINFTINI